MIEYSKIDNVFERDTDGSKKIIEGRYRDPAVEALKNHVWVGTEKVDGTNIGVVWDGHKVGFQGRTERAMIPKHLLDKLNELFGGEENEQLFEQIFGEKNVILFGEGYGVKIQNVGSMYRHDVSFILFDVYFPEKNIWLQRENLEGVAKTFGIDVVPVVYSGNIAGAVAFVKSNPITKVGILSDIPLRMEGIVLKPVGDFLDRTGKRIIVKVKARDFE